MKIDSRFLTSFTLIVGWLALCFASKTTIGAEKDEGGTTVSYHRHVTALLGKLGCNGGSCHGAVKGRNGFRLSMFSADPVGDHARLVREFEGRRLDVFAPDDSLVLLKATGRVPHRGGVRTQVGSREYRALRDWIAAGGPVDDESASPLVKLEVTPHEHVAKPGEQFSLRAVARFVDGREEDVTWLCSFESLDRAVAAVDSDGRVTAMMTGDAGLVVRYRAQPAIARVIVPRATESTKDNGREVAQKEAGQRVAAANFIDSHVLAKLDRLNLPAASVCDDATFFRRLHLDVTGRLPEAEAIREFLADQQLDKRQAAIDRLLSTPAHVDLWTLKFLDLLKAADFGVYADALSKEHDAPRMQAWVRARLAENLPYDEFVARILLATSREGRPMAEYAAEVQAMFEGYAPGRPDLEKYAARKTLDLFWQRRASDGVKGTLQVAHAFLGLRLECAQCHRHPHDNWRQEDLLDFANFFMRVRTVGFQGDNEKKFDDAAAYFKQFNDEAKALEATVKTRKEGEGKTLEEQAKQAKTDVDRLKKEVAAAAKTQAADDAELVAKKRQLDEAQAVVARADAYRAETAAIEKRAKMLPEVARRLLQAESRLLPQGPKAKVTSTLGTAESATFRLLGSAEPSVVPDDGDPRAAVVEWLRRPDNPYFARAIVNRVWAHYFHRGIVDPPDNLSAFNPPSHPELLADLCDRFIRHGYDLRWLHRTILASRTYQQSSTPSPGAEGDRTHFASYPLRRVSAEVLLDALDSATGTSENMDMKYYHWPESISAVQLPYVPRNAFVTFMLETYGRPQRNSAVQCDCERDGSGSVFQVLTLANHPRVWEKIRDKSGRVARLLKDESDDRARVDSLFLATVSRPPADDERQACIEFAGAAATPEQGWHGVLWSLLNTREFLLQH